MSDSKQTTDDICLNCEIFKKKTSELLKQHDSIYDVVIEVKYFTEECKKNCINLKK